MGILHSIRSFGMRSNGSDLWLVDRLYARNVPSKLGRVWYCDSSVSASGDGTRWETAFKTIAAAVAAASAGDTILLYGSFDEAVTSTLDHLSFIGAGPSPNSAVWTAPTVANSFCLKLNGASENLIKNIRFRPVVYTTSGHPYGIYLTGSSHTRIEDCLFQGRAGSHYALYCPGDSDNVVIKNNRFVYMNTATHGTAILVDTADSSGWVLEGNIFHSNVRHVVARLKFATIVDNKFFGVGLAAAGGDLTTTVKLDISGAAQGCNLVSRNIMFGDYSTSSSSYKAGTSDSWIGNIADDLTETEVDANSCMTLAVPAS